MHEGKNRQIRNVAAALGYAVEDIFRVSIGPVHLEGLKPGHSRPLTDEELEGLQTCRNSALLFQEQLKKTRKTSQEGDNSHEGNGSAGRPERRLATVRHRSPGGHSSSSNMSSPSRANKFDDKDGGASSERRRQRAPRRAT